MPKGYMIVIETVRDRARHDAYGRKARPIFDQYGGKVVAAVDDAEPLEGEWPGPRTIILEFESVEAARAFYYSPGYQSVIGERHASSEGIAALVSGFEPPDA